MPAKSKIGKLVRFADPQTMDTLYGHKSFQLKLAFYGAVGLVIEEKQKSPGQPVYCHVQWVKKRWKEIFSKEIYSDYGQAASWSTYINADPNFDFTWISSDELSIVNDNKSNNKNNSEQK